SMPTTLSSLYFSPFPYTTLFRSDHLRHRREIIDCVERQARIERRSDRGAVGVLQDGVAVGRRLGDVRGRDGAAGARAVLADHRRSDEHTTEIQSLTNPVCRLLPE